MDVNNLIEHFDFFFPCLTQLDGIAEMASILGNNLASP